MHPPVVASATANKRRKITLTNRAPIQIIEAEWPIMAQGMCDNDTASAPCPKSKWSIDIRVRKDKIGRTIIYATYSFDDPQHRQLVRV
jgi:hypothetical protein